MTGLRHRDIAFPTPALSSSRPDNPMVNRDVLLVVKGVPYLVDLWPVETALGHDESDIPKDIR